MDLLRLALAAAAVAAAACYEPRLADCVVRCSTGDDCGPGQACGPHGYCAAPDLACAAGGSAADAPALDARPADARPGDAAMTVQLRVKISGSGKVLVEGAGSCDSEGAQDGDCLLAVIAGIPRTLRAQPHDDYTFDQWTSKACEKAGAICDLTLTQPLTEVQAKFRHDD